METLIKFNNQASGRDKLARLLQYGSRALWHFLQQRKVNHQNIEKLRALEYTFSSFRKLLRLGKCVDMLYSSLSSIHYPEIAVRVTVTLSRISMAVYLLADHVLWIGRAGLCSINGERWNRMANKYWMYAVIMNIIRDLYEINRILKMHGLRDLSDPRQGFSNKISVYAQEHKDVIVDTVKNICDVCLPMTALGVLKLSPGAVGLLGVASSAAAIFSMIDPLAKLAPS